MLFISVIVSSIAFIYLFIYLLPLVFEKKKKKKNKKKKKKKKKKKQQQKKKKKKKKNNKKQTKKTTTKKQKMSCHMMPKSFLLAGNIYEPKHYQDT